MIAKPRGRPPTALRPGHQSPMVACLLFFALVSQGNADTTCSRKLSADCLGSNCTQVFPCENGVCSDDGECMCFPCFSGHTCSQYDDGFLPYFTSNEDLVTVDPDINGTVYRATAIDEDIDGVCLKHQQKNSPCLCSKVWYSMSSESAQEDEEDDPFDIEEETGIVYVIPGKRLTPGHSYDLTIFASSVGEKDADSMILHLDVTEAGIRKTREQVDIINYLDVAPGNLEEDEDPFLQYSRSFPESSIEETNQTWNIREKRDSAGANNALDKVTMTLNQIGGITGDLFPGSEVLYQMKLVLPTLDTPTDLKVEIFVMDPVSAVTPFVLCSVNDISIGAGIKDSEGNTISTSNLATLTNNAQTGTFDKAVIDFGLVKNNDAFVEGSTDLDDSTITMNFTAIFINNADYKNSTAVITAGAEYDSGNHVWVGQSKHNFDTTAPVIPIEGEMTCPDTIGEDEAVSCTIKSFISYTMEEVMVEVFTPYDVHDTFTVERMTMLVKGENFYCRDEPVKFESYPSVTGRSNHLARASSYFLNSQSSTQTVAQQLADVGNWITFGFNIHAIDAKEGETIYLGGGIVVGTTKVWVAPFNITVGPPVATEGTASFEVVQVSSSVAPGGVASYGIKTTIPLGQKAAVKCSADNSGDPKIGGVVYGSIGTNIGRLKDIGKWATQADDGKLEWDLGFVYNTGWDTTNAEANVFIMEVGVQYSTSIASTSITCGTETLPLSALTESAASGPPSGQLTVLGTSTTWVQGSQAGVEAKIYFPPQGTTYDLNFEATGDIGIMTYFPAVCRLRLMHTGRGVPTVAFADITGTQVKFEPSRIESTFNDLGILNLGQTGGVQMANPNLDDYNIIVQAAFLLPEGQAGFSGGSYKLNTGVKLGDSAVWTAGATLTTTSSFTAVAPRVKVLPDKTTIAEGESTRVRVVIKTDPGSVGKYKLNVQSSNSDLIICRIIIDYIGDNYPCVTREPFSILHTYLTTTTKDQPIATWKEKGTIDFGTLQNLGTGEAYPTLIADADSIIVSVYVSGVRNGATSLLSTTFGSLSSVSTSFSISSVLPPAGALSAALMKQNDSAEAYEGVMHISTLVLTVPEGYNREVTLRVSTDAAVTDMILCLVALAKVGENVPCTVPVHVVETRNAIGESSQWVQLELGRVCHLKSHELGEQDKLTVYIGTTFTSTGSGATISVSIWEDNVEMTAPSPLTLSKASSAYVDEGHDVNSAVIRAVDNSTTTVTRGSQVMIGFLVDICVNCTFSISFAVVTPAIDGRALATVGGFRWVDGFGKNLGCKAPDCEAYTPLMLQNASSTPFIHESQNDTMAADLFYISNIGLTYLQRIPTEVQDNQLAFEVMVWVADHPVFTDGYTFNVDCSVKVSSIIFVASKPLVVSFTTTEKMALLTSLELVPEQQGAFVANDIVSFTYRVQHVANESMVEVNKAIVRVLMPTYLSYVEGKNTYSSNISNTNITIKHYLDFDIAYLFFTDILELNFTLTVDPYSTMPKGLSEINSTILVRLVGIPGNTGTSFKYCGPTAYVNYLVDSKDCYEDIDISGFDSCQFAASTAMDATTMPEKVITTGWSPAVRSGEGWEHHVTIDFGKTTRVTELRLEPPPADKRPVTSINLQCSRNGFRVSPNCQDTIPVVDNIITIPAQCRGEYRYMRLIVHADSAEETKPICLRISEVKGCYISNETGVCDTSLETMRTVKTDQAKGWRHIAVVPTNLMFYFCDFVPLRGKMVCYCTQDRSQWTALPSYIGELIGYSATEEKMCANDIGGQAVLCSSDGTKWGIIDKATMGDVEENAKLEPALVVPGTGDVEVSLNGYTADFTGVKYGGAYIVKWSSCCT